MTELLNDLFYSSSEPKVDFKQHEHCKFAMFTSVSPTKNRPNEDCAGWIRLKEDHWVFLVADGLGGLPAGDAASQLAISIILEALSSNKSKDVTTALLVGIDTANQAILNTGNGGATTLTAVELEGHIARPIHIGDSTIQITGQRGAVKFTSVSHAPTATMEAAGQISEHESMMHRQRNLVSNVVGSQEMHIDIGPEIKLNRYDTVILASDGLCDNLYRQEIIEGIRKGPLEESLENLVLACRKTMLSGSRNSPNHPDDLTILAFRRNK